MIWTGQLMETNHLRAQLRPHALALAPALVAVGLMLVWAFSDGGYDPGTWYWGALLLLAVIGSLVAGRWGNRLSLSAASRFALAFFALYVVWSYLSISWAQSPGDALQGSNRALLYLLLFALLIALPWTVEGALVTLLAFVLGVGVIGIVMLVRLASAEHLAGILMGGRLSAPTGYFNAAAALFTMDALVAIMLATRRELPALLRGVLIAFACAGLQLALLAESRGWLFTLPLVAIVAIAIVPDRLRFAAAAVIPVAAALVPLRRLLDVYGKDSGSALNHAATRAGHAALLIFAAALMIGTLIAWGETRIRVASPSRARRRLIGTVVTVVAIATVSVAAMRATHGQPFSFIARQWRGFSHTETSASSGSHFADVGSGRYDFWRVALDAVIAHPIGGLGQDNFSDYYISRRHTTEEPVWTHSLELRLLAHTGFVGFGLFSAFLIAAIAAALRARRRADLIVRAVAAAAMLPFVVWLIHGSIDWFWEVPALTGPALGFLAVAAALGEAAPARVPADAQRSRSSPRWLRPAGIAGATGVLLAGAVVLGLPYLSSREVSLAIGVGQSNPAAALRALSRAGKLNPLSADPGRLGGAFALQAGDYATAEQRFGQSISREPGGWFSWLGDGLAASALGDSTQAHHDFVVAAGINSREQAIHDALARVDTRAPLTTAEAFKLLDFG
jgi:O-Antigen ligase